MAAAVVYHSEDGNTLLKYYGCCVCKVRKGLKKLCVKLFLTPKLDSSFICKSCLRANVSASKVCSQVHVTCIVLFLNFISFY